MKSRNKRKIIAGIIIITIILGIMGYAKYNAEMERRRECYRTDIEIALEYLALRQKLYEFAREEGVNYLTPKMTQSKEYDEFLSGYEQVVKKYKEMEQDYNVEYILIQKEEARLQSLKEQKVNYNDIVIFYDETQSIESLQEMLNDPNLVSYLNDHIIFK